MSVRHDRDSCRTDEPLDIAATWANTIDRSLRSGDAALHTHTHTHTFNGLLSGTTRVSRYQKGKNNLDFTEARDSEWQWHQLTICRSAPRSRQTTTPAPHHSVFYRPDMPFLPPNQQRQSTEGNAASCQVNWTACNPCHCRRHFIVHIEYVQ